jgi:hypothetical protein
MNWKLVLQLSLFGVAMGIGTVSLIPSDFEPICWLVIFVVSACLIATRCPGRYFLHGLLVSVANSVWVTASHVLFFNQYVANHAAEASMMASIPVSVSPRVAMAVMGLVVGLISGCVLGVFAIVASRLVSRGSAAEAEDQEQSQAERPRHGGVVSTR